MKPPSAQQREALASLQRYVPQWTLFLDWIQENRTRCMTECARADDEIHTRRLQGQTFVLTELLEALTPKR